MTGAARPPLLDKATLLDRGIWRATAYPKAREATVVWVPAVPPGPSGRPSTPDRDRAEREARRRAATRLRRLAVEHQMWRMWTLTFADEPPDAAAASLRTGEGIRRLRKAIPSLKYVWVPERGSLHGRRHVHLAVDRYIDSVVVQAAWRQGFVGAPKRHRTGGSDPVKMARYLSKYVSKEEASYARTKGQRRFTCSQGLTLTSVTMEARTMAAAERAVAATMGGPPQHVWRSDATDGWRGPPAAAAWW